MKLLLQRLEKLSVENSWDVEKRYPSVKIEEPFLEKVVQKSVGLAKTFLTR